MRKLLKCLLAFVMIFSSITITNAQAPTPPTDLIATLDTQSGDIVVSSEDQTYIESIYEFELKRPNVNTDSTGYNVWNNTVIKDSTNDYYNANIVVNNTGATTVYELHMHKRIYEATPKDTYIIGLKATGYNDAEISGFYLSTAKLDTYQLNIGAWQNQNGSITISCDNDANYIPTISHIEITPKTDNGVGTTTIPVDTSATGNAVIESDNLSITITDNNITNIPIDYYWLGIETDDYVRFNIDDFDLHVGQAINSVAGLNVQIIQDTDYTVYVKVDPSKAEEMAYLKSINHWFMAGCGNVVDYSTGGNSILDETNGTLTLDCVKFGAPSGTHSIRLKASGYQETTWNEAFVFVNPNNTGSEEPDDGSSTIDSSSINITISQPTSTTLEITGPKDYVHNITSIDFVDYGNIGLDWEDVSASYEDNADNTTLTISYEYLKERVNGKYTVKVYATGYTEKTITDVELDKSTIDASKLTVTISQDPETYDLLVTCAQGSDYLNALDNIRFIINDENGHAMHTEWLSVRLNDVQNDDGDFAEKNASIEGNVLRLDYSEFTEIVAGTEYDLVIFGANGYTELVHGPYTMQYGVQDSSDISVLLSQDPETYDLLISCMDSDYLEAITAIDLAIYDNEEYVRSVWIPVNLSDIYYDDYVEHKNADISGNTLRIYYEAFEGEVVANTTFDYVYIYANKYTDKDCGPYTMEYGVVDSKDIPVSIYQDTNEPHHLIVESGNPDYLENIHTIRYCTDDNVWGFGVYLSGEDKNAAIVDGKLMIKYDVLSEVSEGTYEVVIESKGYIAKQMQGTVSFDVEDSNNGTVLYPTEPNEDYALSYDSTTETFTLKTPSSYTLPEDGRLHLGFFETWDEGENYYLNNEYYAHATKVNDITYTFTMDDFEKQDCEFYARYCKIGLFNNLGYEINIIPLTEKEIFVPSIYPMTYKELSLIEDVFELTYTDGVFTLKRKDGEPFETYQDDDGYHINFDLYINIHEYSLTFNVSSVDDKAYTFTVDDAEVDWEVHKPGEYYFVYDYHGVLYKVSDNKFSLPQLGHDTTWISPDELNDEVINYTYDISTGTHTIEFENGINAQYFSLMFMEAAPTADDPDRYIKYGEIPINTIYTDGNNIYYFTKDEYQPVETIVNAGEYEVFLKASSDDQPEVIYDLTKGHKVEFDDSHIKIPEGIIIEETDEGLFITTKNPSSQESQAWFNNILDYIYGEDDEHINDSWYNSEIYVDYKGLVNNYGTKAFETIKDGDTITGFVVSHDTMINSGVRGNIPIRISVETPNYQIFVVDGFELSKGAIDATFIPLEITQDGDTGELIVKSSNKNYLKAINAWFMDGHGNNIVHNNDNPEMNNATYDEENGILRFTISGFEPESRDLRLTATGYTEKEIILDFDLVIPTKSYPNDITVILTSKGLIFRSMDEEYLNAFSAISFQHIINNEAFYISNYVDGNDEYYEMIPDASAYSDPTKGYYVCIDPEVFMEAGAEFEKTYRPYIFAEGYEDNLSLLNQAYNLLAFVDLYEDIENNSDGLDIDLLSELDQTVTEFENVNINPISSVEGFEVTDDIEMIGAVAGIVVTDNNNGIDESTLAYEDGETIDIMIDVVNEEIEDITFSDDNYTVVGVERKLDINLARQQEGKQKETISELPLQVCVAFTQELEEDKVYKILKTHTNTDGTTTQELLDIYIEDEVVYFFTNQFSTFELVEVEETKDDEIIDDGSLDVNIEDLPTINPEENVEDVVVGVEKEETEEILTETVEDLIESIENGKEIVGISENTAQIIEEAIENNDDLEITTTVVVQMIDEKDVDENTIKLMIEAAGKGTIVQYLDLSVLMNVSINGEMVVEGEEVTELSKPITFTIAIPEELKEVEEGYTRTFFIIRVHDGKTDKLPVTVNKDGTLSFTTDKFSSYALAYEDTLTPITQTEDINLISPLMCSLVLSGILLVLLKKRKYLVR